MSITKDSRRSRRKDWHELDNQKTNEDDQMVSAMSKWPVILFGFIPSVVDLHDRWD